MQTAVKSCVCFSSSHSFSPGTPIDLDADASETDIVDVGLDMRPGARETDPAAIGLRRCEQPMAQVLGQAVVDRKLAAHEAVCLGVARPLEPAARENRARDAGASRRSSSACPRSSPSCGVSSARPTFSRLRPMFWSAGQSSGDRHAKDGVEGGTQERLLDPPLEMQKDFEKAMKEPEKHRAAAPVAGARRGGIRLGSRQP